MQSCICGDIAWATANVLKLNDIKTELMHVTSNRTRHLHSLPMSITICNAKFPFIQSVKNFGLTLDCHISKNARLQYCSDMLLSTASFGINSQIPDKYCNCHTCVCFCFVKN